MGEAKNSFICLIKLYTQLRSDGEYDRLGPVRRGDISRDQSDRDPSGPANREDRRRHLQSQRRRRTEGVAPKAAAGDEEGAGRKGGLAGQRPRQVRGDPRRRTLLRRVQEGQESRRPLLSRG